MKLQLPQLSLLFCLLGYGCSSTDSPADAGQAQDATADLDAGLGDVDAQDDVGVPDTGPIAPVSCDVGGLDALPWNPGQGGLLFGDVAGDFAINDLFGGRWSFAEQHTGCESSVFVNYIPTNGSTEDDLWDSSVQPLIDAPFNTHFFFLSWERTGPLRQARLQSMADRINGILYGTVIDEALRAQQFARFHYVTDSVFQIEGSLGAFIQDYIEYQADPSSRADLGDRGMAPPPLPFVFGIDRDQEWDSGGSMTRFVGGPTALEMAAFLPAFYDHKARLRDAESKESGVHRVELLNGRVSERVFDVDATLPSASELSAYDSLEFDVSVNCPHRNVFACSEWDRIARISVCLDSECMARQELVRWITPYWRRGERRWVMDASSLLGLLKNGGGQRFRIEMGPSWERATERDIKVVLKLASRSRGVRATGAERAFGGGNFNEEYNTREPYTFTPPATATKVELVVILSGHGQADSSNCAEWCDHRHGFSVNGNALDEIRHEGTVGAEAGCGPAASQGVPPGQFGNWAPERAYWCPGLPVVHRVIDITEHVTLGQANTLTYQANYRGGAPGGGNISLNAYVSWSE